MVESSGRGLPALSFPDIDQLNTELEALGVIDMAQGRHSEIATIIDPKLIIQKGAEPKLNTEVIHRIVCNLATGATKRIAARAAGISRKTMWLWEQTAKDARSLVEQDEAITEYEQLCLVYVELTAAAEAGIELSLLQTVLKGGETGAKWILARRWPGRWAAKPAPVIHEHTGTILLTWGAVGDVEQIQGDIIDVEAKEVEAPHNVETPDLPALPEPTKSEGLDLGDVDTPDDIYDFDDF